MPALLRQINHKAGQINHKAGKGVARGCVTSALILLNLFRSLALFVLCVQKTFLISNP